MLFKMTCEPDDYEGPWPSEDAMTKPTVDEVMLLVREFGDAQAQLASYRSTSNRRECLLRVRAAIESLIAAPTAPQPDSGDLYWRLHSLSKSMEGRGHIDEGELPDAYPALLDAMAFVRGWSPPAEPQEHTGRWNIDVDDSDGSLRICKGEHEKSEACVYERYVPESKAPLSMDGKPAAPQQAEPVATLYQCLGRWSVELVTGGGNAELSPPQYLLDAIADATRQQTAGVQQPRGPRTPDPTMVICPACTSQFTAIPESVQAEVQRLQDALEKIKLETFDDSAELIARRALAVKLDAIRAAPQQAEPVAWMFDRRYGSGLSFGRPADYENEDGDTISPTPLYRHPPAAEVQRLRDALKPFAEIDLTTNQAVDAMDVLRARRALEGGE